MVGLAAMEDKEGTVLVETRHAVVATAVPLVRLETRAPLAQSKPSRARPDVSWDFNR